MASFQALVMLHIEVSEQLVLFSLKWWLKRMHFSQNQSLSYKGNTTCIYVLRVESPYKKFLSLGTTHELYQIQDKSWYRFIFKRLQLQSFPSCLLDFIGVNLYSCQPTIEVYSSKSHGGFCQRVSWKGEKKLSTLISQMRHVKFSKLLRNICMCLVSVLQAATMHFVNRKCQLMTMF